MLQIIINYDIHKYTLLVIIVTKKIKQKVKCVIWDSLETPKVGDSCLGSYQCSAQVTGLGDSSDHAYFG